jgi:methionine sulfoxide reductase heme-binding subunit
MSVATLALIAATKPSLMMWYLTRATATAAYIALSLSIILGLLRALARQASEHVSWLVDEMHKTIATLAALAVIGHLATVLLDPYLPFKLVNLLVPLNEPYHPLPAAFGVLALYAMALALLTSWLRRRIPYRWWRGIHYVSFVAFALVTAHGWITGSDSSEPWMRLIYSVATGTVAALVIARGFMTGLSLRAQASTSE